MKRMAALLVFSVAFSSAAGAASAADSSVWTLSCTNGISGSFRSAHIAYAHTEPSSPPGSVASKRGSNEVKLTGGTVSSSLKAWKKTFAGGRQGAVQSCTLSGTSSPVTFTLVNAWPSMLEESPDGGIGELDLEYAQLKVETK